MKMESVLRCVCVFGILQEMPEIYVCVIGVTFLRRIPLLPTEWQLVTSSPSPLPFPPSPRGHVTRVEFQCAHLTAAQ